MNNTFSKSRPNLVSKRSNYAELSVIDHRTSRAFEKVIAGSAHRYLVVEGADFLAISPVERRVVSSDLTHLIYVRFTARRIESGGRAPRGTFDGALG